MWHGKTDLCSHPYLPASGGEKKNYSDLNGTLQGE